MIKGCYQTWSPGDKAMALRSFCASGSSVLQFCDRRLPDGSSLPLRKHVTRVLA